MSSGEAPRCSLLKITAVGRVKSKACKGLAVSEKPVRMTCTPAFLNPASISGAESWLTRSTHFWAEAEDLTPHFLNLGNCAGSVSGHFSVV